MENGLKKKIQMSPEKNYLQRKLEKTLNYRHQNNTAMGLLYFTLKKGKKDFIQFFFQNVPILYNFSLNCIFSCRGSCPVKNAIFFYVIPYPCSGLPEFEKGTAFFRSSLLLKYLASKCK